MNILYCGDANIEKGLIVSVLSLLKNTKAALDIFVITMTLEKDGKQYDRVNDSVIASLEKRIKEANPESTIRLLDATEFFLRELPTPNMDTRFTPFCMLRLFADKFPEMPEKILYLDNDVICRKDISELYDTDMESCEIAGVLDHYGKWFFRRKLFGKDYINSGVLLMNMSKIKETGLLAKCRKMCATQEIFMPDQSALNKLAVAKKILPTRYNEQHKLKKSTVLQHFTTRFRYFPRVRTLTVKPWQTEEMHSVLKLHEYDDILNEYELFYRIDG